MPPLPTTTTTTTPPHLQVMAGYMEHLDQMMEQASRIESSLETLKATYASHQQVKNNADTTEPIRATIGWMDVSDIDQLFVQKAGAQKQEISEQLTELKQMLMDAKNIFAVDAPDGNPDAFAQEEMHQIKTLMDEVAVWEDKVEVDARHAQAVEQQKTFAVDAPDGSCDAQFRDEILEIQNLMEDVAEMEDKEFVRRLQAISDDLRKKVFAVDAPDGEADGDLKEEVKQAQSIVDEVANQNTK